MANFDKVFTVKKEVSKEQFLRKLLVELASNKEAPNDVCNAEFGDIQESVKEVILCSAYVEIDYSASVGYERVEDYWDKEEKREYVNGEWRTYFVDVKKTRTVIEWHPYSGHISGDATCAAINDGENKFELEEHQRLVPILKAIKSESIHEEGEATLNFDSFEAVKRNCQTAVAGEISYPGDQVSDEAINANTKIKALTCYKLPYYEIKFVYGGKEYLASGFACGIPNAETQLPPNNVNIKETVQEEVQAYKFGSVVLWIGFVISLLIALSVSGQNSNLQWVWIITPIMLVLAIIVGKKGNDKFDVLMKQKTYENNKQKLENLTTALKSRNLNELAEEEKALFNID